MKKIVLKKGKEHSVKRGHPWIFSGAVERVDEGEEGGLYQLTSSSGEKLAWVYFHSKTSIAARLICGPDEDPKHAVIRRIQSAIKEREAWFQGKTNGYRLINGEGDLIPGLIIDRYGENYVLQASTLGIEQLKSTILEALEGPVYEKSLSPSRKQEHLLPSEGWIKGKGEEEIEIYEGPFRFCVSLPRGQKTGFFLDQRENRKRVFDLSKGKRILNAFSYTGGFSVAALMGGATSVVSVDSSKEAILRLEQNLALNGLLPQVNETSDLFDYFEKKPLTSEEEKYDGIILDPPAFIKKRGDIDKGSRAYSELHKRAFSFVKKGGWLLTCSCSHFMDEERFKKILLQAALIQGRICRIVSSHPMAIDHPILLSHPEGGYLKSFLLLVD